MQRNLAGLAAGSSVVLGAIVLGAVVLGSAVSLRADYSVNDSGEWPKSWPAELDSLRKQARTLEGPLVAYRHYQIPFTDRAQFEAAWPHLLKVKSKGAPLILIRAPKTDFFAIKPAGVLIHTPPVDTEPQELPVARPAGLSTDRTPWLKLVYFELVVDGDIVDLNRIALPADTPIIDERFKGEAKK